MVQRHVIENEKFAQFFIPKHGTVYHDEILLKITRAWYSSLAWYTLSNFALRISQYWKRMLSHFLWY